ncbi:hypothetical protein EDB83DRAFT_2470584, partial [Lactarius deliciosus]
MYSQLVLSTHFFLHLFLRSSFLHHSYYVSLIPLPTPIHQKLIPYGHVQAFEFTHGLSLGYRLPITYYIPTSADPSITILITIRRLRHTFTGNISIYR